MCDTLYRRLYNVYHSTLHFCLKEKQKKYTVSENILKRYMWYVYIKRQNFYVYVVSGHATKTIIDIISVLSKGKFLASLYKKDLMLSYAVVSTSA